MIAHGAILRIRAKNPLIADQVSINYKKADISERQKVFLTLAYRPDEFRAFIAYHDALMERKSGLSKAEKEMIVGFR